MKNGSWKAWLILSVIFALGVATGIGLTLILRPEPALAGAPPPRETRAQVMQRLTRDLDLTPDQQAKIQPIIEASDAEIRENVAHISRIVETTMEKIGPLLTPEQQAKLAQLRKDHERRFSDRLRMRAFGPGHRPRGPLDMDRDRDRDGRPDQGPPPWGRPDGPNEEPSGSGPDASPATNSAPAPSGPGH